MTTNLILPKELLEDQSDAAWFVRDAILKTMHIPECLKKPLVFGDSKQICALKYIEETIAELIEMCNDEDGEDSYSISFEDSVISYINIRNSFSPLI